MRTNFTFYEASYKWSELTDEEKEFYYDKLLDEQKDIITRSRELERKLELSGQDVLIGDENGKTVFEIKVNDLRGE